MDKQSQEREAILQALPQFFREIGANLRAIRSVLIDPKNGLTTPSGFEELLVTERLSEKCDAFLEDWEKLFGGAPKNEL